MKRNYFPENEFECNGVNCFDRMDPELLKMLNVARHDAKTPFVITSSWRSTEYNATLPNSKPNSAHIKGLAVDIFCNNSRDRALILRGLVFAGFTRIGISKDFIHCDIDETKPPTVCWLY